VRILRSGETDLAEDLRRFSERRDLRGGATTAGSDEKTCAVFGRPLTPLEAVRHILRAVRERGDEAVAEYAKKLDGVDLASVGMRVTEAEISAAWDAASPALKAALERAAANIRRYQQAMLPPEPARVVNAQGGVVAVRYRPLRRVGIYVPGGRAGYPSTVLMTAIPAQVAGVEEIVMVTPCGPDGAARPETLAAARLCGIREIHRIGGAQAIAALAYGTRTIPRADMIAGPGNLYVTLAKKEVYGEVAIDMLAGPSEILIIADETADPRFLAADLLGQAEHDPAVTVLLATDRRLAERALAEVERQIPALSRGVAARDCLERYGFFAVTRDLAEAVALANEFAPEHLELAVSDPDALLPTIRNAGAVFVGHHTPESLGDYVAGPSHVLPTGGTARFFSGLSVNDFLRRTSIIRYTREALELTAPDVDVLARAEGLDAHARAVTIRTGDTEDERTGR